MRELETVFPYLRDPRFAVHATSGKPAWLWHPDGAQILWSNPAGAAIFSSETPAALAGRVFDPSELAAIQITRLAGMLPSGGTPRLERLRGFGAGFGRMLTCACSRITIDHISAILVVATEPAGPKFPLSECIRRLLIDEKTALAAFTDDGTLICANPTAASQLAGRTSLSGLGIAAAAASALKDGHAEGDSDLGKISLIRIGTSSATALIAVLPDARAQASDELPESMTAVVPEILPIAAISESGREQADTKSEHENGTIDRVFEPLPMELSVAAEPPSAIKAADISPMERHHPLRFVWQMDAESRFILDSDEFKTLIGPTIAVMMGSPWSDIAAALDLDPQGQVARAFATHDTWSGITIAWPVEGSDQRLITELSGLPIYDRDRVFRGYRGFGVCRDITRIAQLMAQRSARDASAEPMVTTEQTASDHEPSTAIKDKTPSATKSPSRPNVSNERPVLSLVPQVQNIVPFRPSLADGRAAALSPVEHSAFRELAKQLSARLKIGNEEPAQSAAEEIKHPPLPADTSIAPRAIAANETAEITPEEALRPMSRAASADERTILDLLPLGILIYRHDDFIFANRAFLDWTGHETLTAFVEDGGLDILMIDGGKGSIPESNAAGQSLTIETPHGDGRRSEARLFTIPWEDERAMALVLTTARANDVELNRAKSEILELRTILDTAADGILISDDDKRIIASNRAAETLFGYDHGELTGHSLTDIFAPESRRVVIEEFDHLSRDNISRGSSIEREVAGKTSSGGLVPLFMTMGRIADRESKFCLVVHNITRWKTIEEDLINAKRKAEKASSSKSEFFARISHEIRTPLNAIIGFSEVMMDERFGPIGNERYREYLKDIHTSGGHLISLLKDLLDLSKIEAGKLDLTFESVNLNDLTQQTVAIMQPQATRARIIIRTSLPPALPPVVADARSIRQIILNLLSNSIKYTGAGGQIIVSTALSDDGHVVLHVRDTGMGMSEKDIATALEPFRQLTTPTRPDWDGTGLGLPLTKALAEANHAAFSIKSGINAGTLVEITFPATRVLAE